jgi:putative ABC transport system permease protein
MIPFAELSQISIKAIFTNKARSFLTMLGIIIGVASVILLVSIGSGLQSFVTAQFESLGSNAIFVLPGKINPAGAGAGPPSANSKLTLQDARRIKNLGPPITGAIPLISHQTTVSYQGNTEVVEVVGTLPEYKDLRNTAAEKGRWFTNSENERGKKVALLGPTVVEKIYSGRPALKTEITLGDRKFSVIGITEKKGGASIGVDIDKRIYIPYLTAQKIFNLDNANVILVQAKDADAVKQSVKMIQKQLERRLSADDFTVLEQKELLSTIQQFLGVITVALGGIAAISLLVGGVGIMNIMLVSVTERTREIGLRKAVGAKSRDILLQFLFESISLSFTGGTIGLILGALGSLTLNRFLTTTVTPWSIAVAFGFSAMIGIIFGVAPAYKAARLDPIRALRYE